jgi:hypothetical protein
VSTVKTLVRIAQYLLVTFHELFHAKRLVKYNNCKYFLRTPEKVSRFDPRDKVLNAHNGRSGRINKLRRQGYFLKGRFLDSILLKYSDAYRKVHVN